MESIISIAPSDHLAFSFYSGAPTVNARRARHTRPNETNQVAASSAWPRRTARHPWFRSDRSMSAKVTTDLPFGTATTL